ncbi:MAG TPA: hypothetical protein VJM33_19450 [Microthrixaceae bacterium]|nr:hypothetical protein [Microthrixaceae bacterium]
MTARAVLRRPRPEAVFLERYAVVHDISGPRVRLALLWSAGVVVAFVFGTFVLALYFGATAAIGALQAAAQARHAGWTANQALAGIGAAGVTLAAAVNVRMWGLAVIVFALAAVLFPEQFGVPSVLGGLRGETGDGSDPDRPPRPTLAQLAGPTAHTLGPGLLMGLAAASAVQVDRVDAMVFIFLFVAVSTYDAGDFLCGAGYDSLVAGPLAGALGVGVVTAAMYIAQPPPLEGTETLVAGALLMLACPAGQWLASWLLPTARSKAPGLRRLDSWLLAAPAFLVVCWFADG